MSEEAQEARNKDNKMFRLKHARKTSRTDNMSDVFHRLMVTGDIIINNRTNDTQKSRQLPRDVRHLLKQTVLIQTDHDDTSTDSSETDDTQ